MAKRIIIGNWKMNPVTEREAVKLAKASDKIGVVLCVPFIFLSAVKKVLKKAKLGAQNCFYEENGAYTGEVSAGMLYNMGARYVILGHSERRALGESNGDINKKIKASLPAGLVPILCVGEKERDENHEYLNFIKTQLEECLQGVVKNSVSKIIIAYEPVWALSSTVNRHDFIPSEFLEIKIFIKKILSDMFGVKTKLPAIIYGGSVHPDNTLAFIRDGQADGLLPGRDSLDPKKFSEIIKICEASGK